MGSFKPNPFTNKLDRVQKASEISALIADLYLKLDQATHQHVINGAPHFDNGIVIKAGQKVVLDGA